MATTISTDLAQGIAPSTTDNAAETVLEKINLPDAGDVQPVPDLQQRITSIDVWRGLAALAVVAIHVPHHAYRGWRENPFFIPSFLADYGYLGVPVFVVISGFCIHRRAALKAARGDTARPDWFAFWQRRFWRLYPTYLAAIMFSLALAAFHQRYTGWNRFGTDLVLHLLMVHNLTSEYATSLSNGAFWSLGMEEQLYLLYIPLLALLAWSQRRCLVIVLTVTLGWRVAIGSDLFPSDTFIGSWMMWPIAYWLHWTLGAIAVDAWAGNTRLPEWTSSLGAAVALAGVGFILHDNLFNLLGQTQLSSHVWIATLVEYGGRIRIVTDTVFALAFFCVLNWGLSRERAGAFRGWFARRLADIGCISYSLYLVHVPVIYTLDKLVPLGMTPTDWLLRYVIYYAATLTVAAGFYWAVERRFIRTPMQATKPTLT